MTYAIFTVINISNSINNPPSIPYINLNPLIYTMNNNEKLDNILDDLKSKLKKFNFYTNLNVGPIYDFITSENPYRTDRDVIEKLINEIDKLNASTLIRSLDATSKFINIYDTKLTCSYTNNLKLEKVNKKYKVIFKDDQVDEVNTKLDEGNNHFANNLFYMFYLPSFNCINQIKKC